VRACLDGVLRDTTPPSELRSRPWLERIVCAHGEDVLRLGVLCRLAVKLVRKSTGEDRFLCMFVSRDFRQTAPCKATARYILGIALR